MHRRWLLAPAGALFAKWTTQEIYFVTRLKDNAAYEVVEEWAVPENRNIRSDQLIRFTAMAVRVSY